MGSGKLARQAGRAEFSRSPAQGARRATGHPSLLGCGREAEDVAGFMESRIAAAVTVAAMVPIEIGAKRSVAPLPDERQKTTSPSTSEWTGSTARATPPLAILATRAQAAL